VTKLVWPHRPCFRESSPQHLISLPVSQSHNRTVRSQLAVKALVLSGENLTSRMFLLWPRKRRISLAPLVISPETAERGAIPACDAPKPTVLAPNCERFISRQYSRFQRITSPFSWPESAKRVPRKPRATPTPPEVANC